MIETTGDKLKEIFTIATVCNNTIYMRSEEDKLYVYSLDASNSSMILAQFDKSYFVKYEMSERDMAFDRNAFDIIMKRVKKNNATISFYDWEVVFVEKNTHWSVSLLGDGNGRRMPNPAFETGISFKIDVATFQEELTRVRDGGTNLRVEMTADFIKLCGGEYDKNDRIFSLLKKQDLKEYTYNPYEGQDKSAVTYASAFFDWIKIIPTDAELEIRLDKGMPMRIMVSAQNYKYQYIVAPIINQDED